MYCIVLIVSFVLISRGDSVARILNGYTKILEHPHMVSIEFKGSHICAGSLIKPNIVLTAGHCLTSGNSTIQNLALMSVRSGSAIKEVGGQTAQIISACMHPKFVQNYTNKFLDYDVGVIKLDHSLTIDFFTQLINLQPKGVEVPEKSIGTVAGWGALQEKIKYNKYCYNTFCIYDTFPTDRNICFSTSFRPLGFCNDESGGAMVVDGKQVGIVSASLGCALSLFYPDLYTSVGNEEIHDHIDECISKFEN